MVALGGAWRPCSSAQQQHPGTRRPPLPAPAPVRTRSKFKPIEDVATILAKPGKAGKAATPTAEAERAAAAAAAAAATAEGEEEGGGAGGKGEGAGVAALSAWRMAGSALRVRVRFARMLLPVWRPPAPPTKKLQVGRARVLCACMSMRACVCVCVCLCVYTCVCVFVCMLHASMCASVHTWVPAFQPHHAAPLALWQDFVPPRDFNIPPPPVTCDDEFKAQVRARVRVAWARTRIWKRRGPRAQGTGRVATRPAGNGTLHARRPYFRPQAECVMRQLAAAYVEASPSEEEQAAHASPLEANKKLVGPLVPSKFP